MMLWSLFGKIQDSLSVLFTPKKPTASNFNEDPVVDTAIEVPDYAVEGHFVVHANKGEETKRFVIELRYLTDSDFLRLLERAKEEDGFKQKGALVIPCHPQELEKILEESKDDSAKACEGETSSYLVEQVQIVYKSSHLEKLKLKNTQK